MGTGHFQRSKSNLFWLHNKLIKIDDMGYKKIKYFSLSMLFNKAVNIKLHVTKFTLSFNVFNENCQLPQLMLMRKLFAELRTNLLDIQV